MSERKKGAPAVQDISARRMQKLADENRELKQYVADVMARLRENERLFGRLFSLESQVLAATDPEDLCFTLLRGLRSGFELDMVRFWFERDRVMGESPLQGLSERDLVWLEPDEIRNMGLVGRHVCLMRLSNTKGFDWLGKQDAHLGSVAMLMLGDVKRPFGVLGIGSVDADRFSPEQGTDFLQHLAQVVGLTLENSIVRERLARLSVTDTLTGTRNRRFLQPHSHQPLSQWFGKGTQVSALYVDVDDFKALNERLGEAGGDDLLTALCEKIRSYVRQRDPLIRMGGDEFVLLLPGCSVEKAEQIAAKVIDAAAVMDVQGERISLSIGVALSGGDADMAVKGLIAAADRAMYVAKALGGSRFERADDGDDD